MSHVVVSVPSEYGYVLLSTSMSLLITIGIYTWTGSVRKAAKVPYPTPYAFDAFAVDQATSPDPAITRTAAKDGSASNTLATSSEQHKARYKFKCVIRCQDQNTVHLPVILAGVLVAGLRWPVASSVLGTTWNVSRLLYCAGYTGLGPKGRLIGLPGTNLTFIITSLMVGWWGVEMLKA